MKRITIACILLLLYSCAGKQEEMPSTAIDAGRLFIRETLNGNFDDTEGLILPDETNRDIFNALRKRYEKLSPAEKNQYKSASYNINKLEEVGDSITLINYSNDFMVKPVDIKIVRINRQYLIDLKYSYSGNLPIN